MKNIFHSACCVGTRDSEDENNMDAKNNCLHWWLMPFNVLQDGTPYYRRPVGNSPNFMSLDNSLNRDILHSLRFHCIFIRFLLKAEGNYEEENKWDLVMPPQGKLLVDSSAYGNRKRDRLLQHESLKMLIESWKHWRLSIVKMARRFKDWQIGIDTDDWWWVMEKVGGGEAR